MCMLKRRYQEFLVAHLYSNRSTKNKLKTSLHEAETIYLKIAMSRARAYPRLAVYMWKCVNRLIGHDKQ